MARAVDSDSSEECDAMDSLLNPRERVKRYSLSHTTNRKMLPPAPQKISDVMLDMSEQVIVVSRDAIFEYMVDP